MTRPNGFRGSSNWWQYGREVFSSWSGTICWLSFWVTDFWVFCTEQFWFTTTEWGRAFTSSASYRHGKTSKSVRKSSQISFFLNSILNFVCFFLVFRANVLLLVIRYAYCISKDFFSLKFLIQLFLQSQPEWKPKISKFGWVLGIFIFKIMNQQ